MNKLNIIIISLMFGNIFLSLPVSLYSIYKKKESIFTISLFLAILGFYFIPETNDYDIARYFLIFEDEICRQEFFTSDGGIILKYVIKFLIYLKLPKNMLPFISAFVSYYFLLKVFEKSIDKKNVSNLTYFSLFIISYISIPIIGYTGMRFLPATAIFIFAIIVEKNKYIRLVYMIFSILIHTSILVPVLIFYFCKFFLKKRIRFNKILILTSIFLGAFLEPYKLLNLFNEINKFNIIYISPNYILGKWGMGFIESRITLISKLVNYILLYLRFIIIFLFNIFFYNNKNNKNFIKKNFILLFSCFCFMLYRYFTFWERYTNILIFIIYFTIILKNIRSIKYNLFKFMIIIYFFLNLIYDLRKYYICFYISYNNILKISIIDMLIEIIKNYT